jgi:SAM-dependent methyltransferase
LSAAPRRALGNPASKPGSLTHDAATHFAFGRNWRAFSRHIDAARIDEAVGALRTLLGSEPLTGRSFLDIGCGSGIHSLAALRLGAGRVEAVDLDPESVATTRDTLERHAKGGRYAVREANVFTLRAELGESFDVVYSWGVLHHTGDMWAAVREAGRLVRPGGVLAIALYKKTPLCGFWAREKRFFSHAGPVAREAIVAAYLSLKVLRDVVRLRNPLRQFSGEPGRRGMHWRANAVDWLGGHPYESASPEEVKAFLEPLGFRLEASFRTRARLGILGTGNAEYRFRRLPGPTPDALA